MSRHRIVLLSALLSLYFFNCKTEGNQTAETTVDNKRDSASNSKYYEEPGYVSVTEENEENKFRPTLPLDQAAFKGSGPEEQKRLENEFEFIFDKTWKVNGRVIAGDDRVHKKKQETYRFNRDGSYSYNVEGTDGKGTWKGWMNENVPVITVFPENLNEKVSEWNIKNTGKTMIWSGTTSYKDNAVMIQFVFNK